MSYSTIQYQVDAGVAHVVLDRPDAGNALNIELGRELLDASIRAAGDKAVRCVLIRSSSDVFGFGGDLKYFSTRSDDIAACLLETTTYVHGAIARFQHMQKPVVIAVNGMAAGAGFSLALFGDIVMAGDGAKFKMAYTAAGLSPDGSSSWYLPRLVGLRRAQELMITNRTLSATEAQDWGIVTTVVPDAELADQSLAMAKKLAGGPTRAFGAVKRLLARSFEQGLEAQMDDESRVIAEMAESPDGREGLAAFVGKRKPTFTGA